MKIGIIADIHADYAGLVEVLRRLDDEHRVDTILCAGDLTGYGKEPNPVIELVRQRAIPTAKGNHDSPSKDISPENAAYLRALPLSFRLQVDNQRLYMCHARPGIPFIGLNPQTMSREDLDALLDSADADIMIVGHTHAPVLVQTTRGMLFNPGSVYCRGTEGTSHSYGILHLPEMRFELFDLLQPFSSSLVPPDTYIHSLT